MIRILLRNVVGTAFGLSGYLWGVVFLTLFSGAANAQTPVLNNIVSPSPNAAALGEYVITP